MARIAACNVAFREVHDFADFAAHLGELLDRCAGADLVLLPELVTFELMTATPSWATAAGLEPALETAEFAEEFGELMARESAAREQFILAGSHLARVDSQSFRNLAVLYGPDGTVVHEHAKTHLFPFEHTIGIVEGDDMTMLDLPFGKVGLLICYEAEIPECAATLTEQGAEILLCPSLTLTEAGFWRVRHCLAARTIENQVYAVHAGSAGPARKVWPGSWARSSVLSPCDEGWPDNGVLVESAINADDVVIADLDLEQLAANRESGAATTYHDRRRRAELYTTWPTHIPR